MKLTGMLIIFVVVVVSSIAASDPPSAEDLVRGAIEAHGGSSAIEGYPDLEMTGTAESFRGGSGRRYDIVYRERADGGYRREMTLEFRSRKWTPVEFYDGEIRKRRYSRGWDDLPIDEPAEGAAHRLPMLLSLDLGEAEVAGAATESDRAVWQIRIPDGRDTAVLSFDRESGLLVAIEYPGTSAAGMGTKEEVQRKLVFLDHRPVGDLMLPYEIVTYEDGGQTGHLRFETIEILEMFDPMWVRVPDPTRRFIPSEELAF